MSELIKALERAGYTTRHVKEHWEGGWRDRRWYGSEGIFEVVTANHYMRVTPTDSGAFEVREYMSDKYPERPKTEFFIDPFREVKTLDLPPLLVVLEKLNELRREEAA